MPERTDRLVAARTPCTRLPPCALLAGGQTGGAVVSTRYRYTTAPCPPRPGCTRRLKPLGRCVWRLQASRKKEKNMTAGAGAGAGGVGFPIAGRLPFPLRFRFHLIFIYFAPAVLKGNVHSVGSRLFALPRTDPATTDRRPPLALPALNVPKSPYPWEGRWDTTSYLDHYRTRSTHAPRTTHSSCGSVVTPATDTNVKECDVC